jgi:hypothetical protein
VSEKSGVVGAAATFSPHACLIPSSHPCGGEPTLSLTGRARPGLVRRPSQRSVQAPPGDVARRVSIAYRMSPETRPAGRRQQILTPLLGIEWHAS